MSIAARARACTGSTSSPISSPARSGPCASTAAPGSRPSAPAQISPDVGQINDPSSFGEDARGNLYLVDFDGDVFRLTPQVVSADQGDDLRGGGGNDMVFAGSGADRVFGEAGRDALDGGLGDDLLDGGEGADQIFGGAGADTVSYIDAPRAVLINLTARPRPTASTPTRCRRSRTRSARPSATSS